jgi:hypothetical protein
MMFWFKRKKLVLDAFTVDAAIHNLYPITAMKENYPDWWKKIPASISRTNQHGLTWPMSTIRQCDGILSLYSGGFSLPLWTDLVVETHLDGSFAYQLAKNMDNAITEHARDQMGPEFDNLIHFTLLSPWVFSEKTGVEFYFAPAWWNQIKLVPDMYVPPGILNFKYQVTSNINLFFPRIENKLKISAGQPMVQLIPLTEKNMEIKCHVISNEEWRRRVGIHATTTFQNAYKLKKKVLQDKEKTKCPFGFGRK